MQSLARRQVVFTLGMLFCGVVGAAVALGWVGVKGVEGVTYSVLLCLVPGWLTIYAADLMRQRSLAAYIVLVGTGLRILFVLLGLMAVATLRQDLGFREFTVWLVASYLAALVLETWIVLLPSTSKAAD